jgi:hypothetical protein
VGDEDGERSGAAAEGGCSITPSFLRDERSPSLAYRCDVVKQLIFNQVID